MLEMCLKGRGSEEAVTMVHTAEPQRSTGLLEEPGMLAMPVGKFGHRWRSLNLWLPLKDHRVARKNRDDVDAWLSVFALAFNI